MSRNRRQIRSALITGPTGFIGAHLAERLLTGGVRVRALARDPASASWLTRLGAEVRRGDVREPLGTAADGVDTVFHLAAIVGPAAVPAREFHAVNAGGTRNVMDGCRRSPGVERIVHVSTVAVTEGLVAGSLVDEGSRPSPTSRYAASKWAAEQIAQEAAQSGLPVVMTRPPWVYGWRSPGAVKLFRLIARRRMVLIGSALNATQPVAVEDVVDGLLRAATVQGIDGQVYQLAGPAPITVKEMCGEIAAALNVPPPSIHIPMPLATAAAAVFEWGYPLFKGKPPIDSNKLALFRTDHRFSIAKANRDLGWTPTIAFHDGARRTAADLLGHGLLQAP